GSRGTATAQSAGGCVSRELVAPAAGMTVARPIPLRASRRVAVGLGQRFSEGSASSARPFSGILGKYFRTKNSSRSHAGATRGGFLDPGGPAGLRATCIGKKRSGARELF